MWFVDDSLTGPSMLILLYRGDDSTRMTPDSATEAGAGEGPDGASGVPYEVTSDDRTWGIIAHAAALLGLIVPFGNILGPLLVWAIKKDGSQFVADNGREALNFQITWTIFLVIAALLVLVGIGLLLLPLVGLAWLILVVIAIIRASDEQVYDYPLTLDLVS
jgi:hypothetical protein